jgi:SAM-dependent methyltransferase
MSSMDEYDVYAMTYDAQYGGFSDDVPFYVKEAKRAHPPVLELACGTGRVLIPVVQAGVRVYGLDASPAMVEVCRRKVAELPEEVQARVTLFEADMRDFSFDERFGLIYCPFRAFLHLMTTEDQMAALRNIHAHLRDGGRFAINFFNPDPAYIAEAASQGRGLAKIVKEFAHPESGNKVIEWCTLGHDPVEQRIEVYFIHDEVDAGGELIRRTYKPMRLRWIYRYEFEHLLARCGFEVEALYGGFDRCPLTDMRQELVWIARRV